MIVGGNSVNPGNAGQAENRMVRRVSREAVPNPQEAGVRSAVSAHGSGRGSSRVEREEQEGYRVHSLRISEEILNSGPLNR